MNEEVLIEKREEDFHIENQKQEDLTEDTVKILFKIPFTSVQDHSFQIPLDWDILKVKNFLFLNHPNKPGLPNQKLIYAGRLLNNKTLVRDILEDVENE
jgi:hypothetical protein